ncbi:LysR family transcriptional regulator [Neptuniibacter marinus]|uniref:LysR family transcriptional regulator n=1 Tax=Neptuniibacter marinus TaxID=1806670 RepID=UPI00083682FD|nr:LysR family transcriptional regulator [Neptuniibacter marinus]
MNLRSVDLNLLVVLQVLLDEQHVSKAAKKLQMSQPAVSRALQRLRQTLDDPILVRTLNGYDLSARAVTIRQQLKQVLLDVEGIMQPEHFDPSKAEGVLKLTGLDLELVLLMPTVVKMLRLKAPNLRVEIVPQRSEHFDLLEQGEVHFLATGLQPKTVQDQYRRMEVVKTNHVCVMDKNNPLAKGMTLEQYVAASHGLVSITGKGPGVMDEVLTEMGYKRKIMLRLANFMSVSAFCSGSDLVFTLPEIMGKHLMFNDDLVIRPLPKEVDLPNVTFYFYWHERFQHDPMCSWVRSELEQLLENSSV